MNFYELEGDATVVEPEYESHVRLAGLQQLHVEQLREAVRDGCDIMGYLWWGPIDIVSAGTGEPYGIAGLETQVLRRVGDAWKIAHIQYHGK